MKKHFRTFSVLLIVMLLISISVNVVLALDTTQAEPGSEQDPLVSKSYVDTNTSKNDAVIKQLQAEVETLKNKANEAVAASEGFIVVELEAGYKILTGGGAEIMLRSGKAISIGGQNGGLSDATAAKDLTTSAAVAPNHLLISSRDDGRGMKASIKCYLLVRGTYKIEKAADTSVTTPVQDNGEQTAVQIATVNAASMRIRSGPGTENSIAGSLVKGDKVTVLGKSGEWSNIKNAQGIQGWVMTQYLTF